MKDLLLDTSRVALVGIGAAAIIDVWLLSLKRLNVPTHNFALLCLVRAHGGSAAGSTFPAEREVTTDSQIAGAGCPVGRGWLFQLTHSALRCSRYW